MTVLTTITDDLKKALMNNRFIYSDHDEIACSQQWQRGHNGGGGEQTVDKEF